MADTAISSSVQPANQRCRYRGRLITSGPVMSANPLSQVMVSVINKIVVVLTPGLSSLASSRLKSYQNKNSPMPFRSVHLLLLPFNAAFVGAAGYRRREKSLFHRRPGVRTIYKGDSPVGLSRRQQQTARWLPLDKRNALGLSRRHSWKRGHDSEAERPTRRAV